MTTTSSRRPVLPLSRAEEALRIVFAVGLLAAFIVWPTIHSVLPLIVFAGGFIVLVVLVLPYPPSQINPRWPWPFGYRRLPHVRWAPAWCFILVLGMAVVFIPNAALAPWYVMVPAGALLAAGMYSLLGWWMHREPEDDEQALT